MSISQQTVSYQLKNSEKILSSDAREPTSHMRIQNQIRYDFEKDLIVELEELYRLTNITQQLANKLADNSPTTRQQMRRDSCKSQ